MTEQDPDDAAAPATKTADSKTASSAPTAQEQTPPTINEVDDFGLPIRKALPSRTYEDEQKPGLKPVSTANGTANALDAEKLTVPKPEPSPARTDVSDDDEFRDALSSPALEEGDATTEGAEGKAEEKRGAEAGGETGQHAEAANGTIHSESEVKLKDAKPELALEPTTQPKSPTADENPSSGLHDIADEPPKSATSTTDPSNDHKTKARLSAANGVSEFSHQQLATDKTEEEEDEGEWQDMPAFAPYDIYDDDNRLIAREAADSDDEVFKYGTTGGAGNGYTRVQLDEDAQSATSLDEDTQYLFGMNGKGTAGIEEDDDVRDAVSQLQATKDLLTEGQRIAYVGVTRLVLAEMLKTVEDNAAAAPKSAKKEAATTLEAMKMWSQKMIVRLYAHMEISTAEQVMIEQLAEHGVGPNDLTPTLMQNARVRNPMADTDSVSSTLSPPIMSPNRTSYESRSPRLSVSRSPEPYASPAPPSYHEMDGEDLPEVRTPSQLPTTQKIDIDLRWTVLCDLFLTLIADSIYDARSRVLLEKVGDYMGITWLDICRFEKRVTDALEMQQQAETENWNEAEHMENRRKLALRKRYMMMGLATVGGGLVIGLSAGLLAPVIGAGLAAGFSTIGVAGTSGFLAGAGGAAIITTSSAAAGGIVGVRAANRRTGAVKTFEYRPLHNNKRVNLIVTVSGWMTGKVDDVRLPFSTVDPIMGDIYSILWEPDMLRSMGDTINILATEALTQGLQQVLGSTILISLMSALQLPVVLTKLSYLIDNPWAVSLDRATATGLILADSLIDRNLGTRPITFVGYSLGSRVIFSCLKELAKKGAYGLVQNVYLFGSPMVAKKDEYSKARSVVSGRFVNGYAKNDWILGYLFRLTNGGISTVAGLSEVDVPGIENVDVTDLVPGHMAYRGAMPKLLREVGWLVESDEFSEIEDPDPENHEARQRELINEIEEARKNLEKQGGQGNKSKFGFFGRKKKAPARKEWEVYQETKPTEDTPSSRPESPSPNTGVLFDVDAIRAELAREKGNEAIEPIEPLEIKELKSTLPPMKLDMSAASPQPPALRETKSWSSVPRNGNDSYHTSAYQEDDIQMTFDTSYSTPPSRDERPHRKDANGEQRPDFKSANTMPSLGTHNAWADDYDDEDFGGEKEISMTFA